MIAFISSPGSSEWVGPFFWVGMAIFTAVVIGSAIAASKL